MVCKLLELCKIKILVIPVYPLLKTTFDAYFNTLEQYAVVNMSDLTPPDPKIAKYTEQLYHNNYLYFDFITSYDKDTNQLEEMILSKQIFGVIGIMHCQQVKDLRIGMKRFQQALQRYPTSLAYRCFAFEPAEHQVDDTKGLIMIPNVGDLGFYLQTMINDFTADILLGFGSLVKMGQLERKTLINGPVIIAQQFATGQITANVQPGTPNDSAANASPRYLETKSESSSGFQNVIQQQISSSILNPDKIRKRTPARVQKLIGDLYLLVGKLELAIGCYSYAIELMKSSYDSQWHAASMEGLLCAQLLNTLPESEKFMKENSKKAFYPGVASTVEIVNRAKVCGELQLYANDLPEKYREIVALYDRAFSYGTLGFYPILQHEACFKVTEFLIACHSEGFNHTFYNGAGIASWPIENKSILTAAAGQPLGPPPLANQQSFALLDGIVLQNGTGASKIDIHSWLSRAWLSGSEFLNLKDYLVSLSLISKYYGSIGFKRKEAFFLRLTGIAAQALSTKNGLKTLDDAPSISCLKKSIDLLMKLDEVSPFLDFAGLEIEGISKSEFNLPVPYGWPMLQVSILRECIEMAESCLEHKSTIYFTSILLRHLYPHLSKNEQTFVSDILQRVVTYGKATAFNDPTTPLTKPLLKNETGRILGIPYLLKMQLVETSSGLSCQRHSRNQLKKETQKDVFLYNPYAKKEASKATQIIAVKGELLYVDITLSNPFSFDVDIQQLSLHVNGLFKPNYVSTVLPAQCNSHSVRISGTPLETGNLEILGVNIVMLGGSIEEMLYTYRTTSVLKKQAYLYRIFERTRLGKKQLEDNLVVPVIPPQPILELVSSSLGLHRGLSCIEGERTSFSLEFRNIGKTTINLFSVTIKETTSDSETANDDQFSVYEKSVYQSSLRSCWVSDDISLKTSFLEKESPVANYSRPGQEEISHLLENEFVPDTTRKLDLSFFGKRGCSHISVNITYGTVSQESEEVEFYTRQLSVPILVTVICPLRIRNTNFLNYASTTTISASTETAETDTRLSSISNLESLKANGDFFLLTFDLFNEWEEPFEITFDVYDGDELKCSLNTLLHAGVTKRIVLPIKKFLLSKTITDQAIPSPQWKQFIVGKTPVTGETMRRALFWYRNRLIGGLEERGSLVAKWKCSNNRFGLLRLRDIFLDQSSLAVVRSPSIVILADVASSVSVNKPVQLCWNFENKTDGDINLYFRSYPIDSCGNLANSIIWIGERESIIAIQKAGSFTFKQQFIPTSHGTFQVLGHVEEIGVQLVETVQQKGKYEPPNLILGALQKTHWIPEPAVFCCE